MSDRLRCRKFRESDIVFADGLREAAGWNQTQADWSRFLEHEPFGCFVAEWKGEAAGTVTTTRHGADLGWIGMMLVHPDFRRRRVATGLMEAAMGYLRERGVGCIKLDATPEGAAVYEKLGFRAEWELHRWEGEPEGTARHEIEELPLPMKFDVEAFGADRSEWLKRIAKDAAAVRAARDGDGVPCAFGMWRRGERANYLGPVSAANAAAGRAVVEELLGSLAGKTFWDIPEANGEAIAAAQAHGFARARHLLRMRAGAENVEGRPELQFGIADPAAG